MSQIIEQIQDAYCILSGLQGLDGERTQQRKLMLAQTRSLTQCLADI